MALGYDAAGRRTSLTLPNGIVTEYAYDAASELTGLTYRLGGNVLGTLTYAYDPAGQRSATGGTWARTLPPTPVLNATYDAANRQLTFGDKTMTYDANGNLTSITDPTGTTTFTWDARDRLVNLAGPGLTANFSYDALGRRVRKTINGTTTDVLYDRLNPVQELSGGSVVANLLTGLGIDEYLTRTDATGTQTLLTDALGSTVALTDSAGSVQTQYTYGPFGATTFTGAPSANPFQYTGRENDGTGLYYYRARYYHPGLQRFISEDPVGFEGGINWYSYVENNPITGVDPLGLFGVFGPGLTNVRPDRPVRSKSQDGDNPPPPPLPPPVPKRIPPDKDPCRVAPCNFCNYHGQFCVNGQAVRRPPFQPREPLDTPLPRPDD